MNICLYFAAFILFQIKITDNITSTHPYKWKKSSGSLVLLPADKKITVSL